MPWADYAAFERIYRYIQHYSTCNSSSTTRIGHACTYHKVRVELIRMQQRRPSFTQLARHAQRRNRVLAAVVRRGRCHARQRFDGRNYEVPGGCAIVLGARKQGTGKQQRRDANSSHSRKRPHQRESTAAINEGGAR